MLRIVFGICLRVSSPGRTASSLAGPCPPRWAASSLAGPRPPLAGRVLLARAVSSGHLSVPLPVRFGTLFTWGLLPPALHQAWLRLCLVLTALPSIPTSLPLVPRRLSVHFLWAVLVFIAAGLFSSRGAGPALRWRALWWRWPPCGRGLSGTRAPGL